MILIMAKCIAIAKSTGLRCGQNGIENGLCRQHAVMVAEGKEVNFAVSGDVKPNRRKSKKEVKRPKPDVKENVFAELINSVNTGSELSEEAQEELSIFSDLEEEIKASADANAAKAPVEEVIEPEFEIIIPEKEKKGTKNERKYKYNPDAANNLVNPEDIFADDRYSYLLEYVSMDAVKDKHLLATILVSVAGMSYEQVLEESDIAKQREDNISFELKALREEVNAKYSKNNIPKAMKTKIQKLSDDVTDLKNYRAVLLAAFSKYDAQDEPVQAEKGDSIWSKFMGWMDKHWKSFTATCLILAGIIMVLVALMSQADTFDTAPKKETKPAPSVVVNKPVVDEKPVVNDKPIVTAKPVVDDTVAPVKVQVDTAIVHDGDTLWDIAVQVYGDGSQWTKIWDANKDNLIKSDSRNATDAGHWIHPGQIIDIPLGGNN
jgi:nucleoid-associated protein YgaU